MTSQQQTVIRRNQLPAMLGISMATIDRIRLSGNFPKPIQLGEQAIGFKRSDVVDWIASRPLCNHFMASL